MEIGPKSKLTTFFALAPPGRLIEIARFAKLRTCSMDGGKLATLGRSPAWATCRSKTS
jgi:hypothetical protein